MLEAIREMTAPAIERETQTLRQLLGKAENCSPIVRLRSRFSSSRGQLTPQLQACAEATAEAAQSRARQQELEKTLIQWDRANDLEGHATVLKGQLESLKIELGAQESLLEVRRTEVFDELDAEFADLVVAIGVPGVSTATQVAYWISLMNVALRLRETHFPAFLLMDSPRTSLNDNDDLSAALYRRLVTMADAADGGVQTINASTE